MDHHDRLDLLLDLRLSRCSAPSPTDATMGVGGGEMPWRSLLEMEPTLEALVVAGEQAAEADDFEVIMAGTCLLEALELLREALVGLKRATGRGEVRAAMREAGIGVAP